MMNVSTVRMLLLAACLLAPAAASAAGDGEDYSQGERLLFMSNQLRNVQAPASLSYSFRKSGSLEAPFTDTVTIALSRQSDGDCCAVSGDFLSGPRRLALPPIERAEANPVTLYFLEHDVREMQRLTNGQPNHFRKRIRMAIYSEATVENVSVAYRGRAVAAQQIRISPYDNDSSRHRFEKFARKEYVFTLSDAVPGGVVSIRSVISAGGGEPPLITEEMLLDGAEKADVK